eukprot:TRINITY_DN2376_c0_g1_i2.p1 TRINITY_DN2376_c0_g1~~TRINITY_DN2376_c0_g1_i2.p1  ORF type:complete len:451 (+),score=61.89 TRINITY_DN2376_c0_g1_i2:80-1432(+)
MLLKFVEMSGDPRTLPVEAPTKKIPVRVKRVCVACRASHHSCGIERPCRRCVSRGTECVDAECRKRGRKPHQDLDGLTEGFIIDFSHNFQTEPASDADHAQLDSRTSTPTESHMNRDGDVKYPKDNQANSPVDRDAVSVSQNHSNHSPLIQAEGNTPEPNTFAVHPYLCPQSTMQLQIDAGQAVMIDPFGQITYVSVESPQVVRIEAAASPIALSTTEQLQTLSNIMYQNQLHSQGQSQLQNQVDSLHHQQMAAMLAPPPIVYNTMVDLRNDPAEQYRLESSITHRSSLEALYPAKAPYSYQATISRPVYVPHDQTERDFSSIKPSQFQNDLASYAQDILTTHLEQHAKTRKANSFTPLSSTYRLGHPKMDRVEAFSIICMRMVETLALIPDHVMSADPVRQVMWISRLLKNVVLFSLKGPLPMTVSCCRYPAILHPHHIELILQSLFLV